MKLKILLDEKNLVDNKTYKPNAIMGETFTQDGFEIMLGGFQNTPGWTSKVILAVKNIENEEKIFSINPSPLLIDDLGNQYERIKIERSNQIKETIIYPGTVRRGSIYFEPINPDAKYLRLIIYLNKKMYEFGFEAESKILEEKSFISNISVNIPINAAMGETITQGGFEINLKNFQTTPDWASQVIVSVKNIETEEQEFKYNFTPVLIDDLGNQYDLINIQRSTQIKQTTLAPLARIEGTIYFEPVRVEAKYIIFILKISSEKYVFGFEPK